MRSEESEVTPFVYTTSFHYKRVLIFDITRRMKKKRLKWAIILMLLATAAGIKVEARFEDKAVIIVVLVFPDL